MQYQINTGNYCDFQRYEVQKLPPRSYFIPYPDRESADAVTPKEKRYQSPKVLCLNGDWDFKFYPRPDELPDVLDTDQVEFDRLDVPSCWQFRGIAKPFYVNLRYQFPYNPPEIPTTEKAGKTFFWIGSDEGVFPRWRTPDDQYNFVGVYRRFFPVKDTGKRHILSFLGVASCADVFVNGAFAGYSEGSHNTAEFDISGLIKEGENELVVVVHRWCNGTYLECQDMFRNNGIFRDVLLRISDPGDLWDLAFETEPTSQGYTANVSASLEGEGRVRFTLEGNGLNVTQTAESKDGQVQVTFPDLPVTEWNAQSPVLYNLYCETEHSCVKTRVGFRSSAVDGDIFRYNGKKIKFHGVNHHDTSPTNGYVLSPDEIERDLLLCKEYNIDTIRTSHYPPDPLLLELCDELGIYVVDEADLETHGTMAHVYPPSYNRITDDPAWESHCLERIRCLFQRDKLHVSVFMWSLGNEAGGAYCTDKMYEYLKQQSSLPVHYESVVHTDRIAYDVASEMYPPVERLHEVGEKTCEIPQFCDRPYFLCEYAHAMGVGPGNTEAYWKEIYQYDNLMGGCVWEMVDHAVLHEDGSYTYGGDHGEWEHDGNFCVDGMFYPDRTPSTGARIIRYIYRPIRVSYLGGDRFELFNTTAFAPGGRYRLDCSFSDGDSFTLVPEAGPMSASIVHLETANRIKAAKEAGRDLFLNVTTIDTQTGREAAKEQVILCEYFPPVPEDAGKSALPESLAAHGFGISLPLEKGSLEPQPPHTILFRAPTDNDCNMFGQNTMSDFIDEEESLVSIDRQECRMQIVTRITCKNQVFLCTDTYEGTGEGILVTSHLHCEKGSGTLPRFGKVYRLDSAYDAVRYYARNGESYADMKEQAPIEEVSCSVKEMTEPNIRPQESGNRCDCRWASVSNGSQTVSFRAVEKAFELGIKPYSDRELSRMRHREDEVRTGTYVAVSAFQMGIGTGICGPQTAPEYCYPMDQDYVLRFLIQIS